MLTPTLHVHTRRINPYLPFPKEGIALAAAFLITQYKSNKREKERLTVQKVHIFSQKVHTFHKKSYLCSPVIAGK